MFAVSSINDDSLNISHIDSSDSWWTGIALVNTTDSSKTVTYTFDDDSQYGLTLAAGQHWAGLISSFDRIDNANVRSAQISNAAGIVGLELFGGTTGGYLSGILLNDQTATSLYYPHVASDDIWWTGLVTYNPGFSDASLTIYTLPKNKKHLAN